MFTQPELKKLKAGYLEAAQKNMAKFVKENRAVLQQLNEATLDSLKAGDTPGIATAAYNLFTAAQSFGRQDITNIAEMLHKTIKKPKFAQEQEVLVIFEKALRVLGGREWAVPELESSISKNIHEVLRKFNIQP